MGKSEQCLIIGFILAANHFIIISGSVTIVNSVCTRGSVWTPNVTTVQNWCLSCYCVSGTVSICRANIFSKCTVTGTGVVTTVSPPTVAPSTTLPTVAPTSPVTTATVPTTIVTPTTTLPTTAATSVATTTTTVAPTTTTTTTTAAPTSPLPGGK